LEGLGNLLEATESSGVDVTALTEAKEQLTLQLGAVQARFGPAIEAAAGTQDAALAHLREE
jgi:hypothetical protein